MSARGPRPPEVFEDSGCRLPGCGEDVGREVLHARVLELHEHVRVLPAVARDLFDPHLHRRASPFSGKWPCSAIIAAATREPSSWSSPPRVPSAARSVSSFMFSWITSYGSRFSSAHSGSQYQNVPPSCFRIW